MALSKRLNWMTADELYKLPSPGFTISGVLPAKSIGAIAGSYASCKSFLVTEMAYAIGSGMPWLGRYPVSEGGVVYVQGEGQEGTKKRVRALEMSKNVQLGNVRWVDADQSAVNLTDLASVEQLARDAETWFVGNPVRLVVFDTLLACAPGAALSHHSVMTRIVRSCKRFRDLLEATVLVVHHLPKKGKGLLGSVALESCLDWIFLAQQSERSKSIISLTNVKQKDSVQLDDLHFEKVVVTTDLAMEDPTSLVLRLSEDDIHKMNQAQHLVYDSLQQLLSHSPQGVSGSDWAAFAGQRGIKQTRFYELKSQLQGLNVVEAIGNNHAKSTIYRLCDHRAKAAEKAETGAGDNITTCES
jgi:hypothetical protein